jgi:hypothetical protein
MGGFRADLDVVRNAQSLVATHASAQNEVGDAHKTR